MEASTQLLWHSTVTVDGVAMDEGAIDENKTKSERKAVIKFFKSFFPKGYTWLQVVAFVKNINIKNPVA